jgi:uncharacterized protein DUF4157
LHARATTSLPSPGGLGDLVNPRRVAGKAAGALVEKGFDHVVSASIATSIGPLAVVPAWDADIDAYTRYNRADGAKIQAGRFRSPRWHQNGMILTLQPHAAAMTLGVDIFVRSGHWNEWTYVHELVHVAQYNAGRVPFLISYFSSAAKEIVKRVVAGKPIDPLTAAPHETEAYAVEKRFVQWLRAGKPARSTVPDPAVEHRGASLDRR